NKLLAEVPIQEINIDGNNLTSNHDVKLTSRPGVLIAYAGRQYKMTALDADVQVEKTFAVQVRKIDLGVPGVTTEIAGRVEDFRNPLLDARVNSTIQLESLPQYIDTTERMQGTVQLAGTAKGHLNDLQANLKVSAQGLTVDRYSNVNVDGEADYDAGS